MEKYKKFSKWTISFVLVIAVLLAVILPLTINNNDDTSLKNLVAEEMANGSDASDSGASSADKSKKGGAIYLEPYSTYTMNGGTISGSSNTYGGAIFVSTGATFTMNGGTIKNCSAEYGGGIYVSSGATLTINSGTITGCTASKEGPAIYIEAGAIVDIDESANISKNDIYQYTSWTPPEIGAEEAVGDPSSSTAIKFKTIEFGRFPRTYVGANLNAELEEWYSQGQEAITSFNVSSTTWEEYKYNDGQVYARGLQTTSYSDSTYSDGTIVYSNRNTIGWFKVEPIRWYVLNYETMSQDGYMEILCTQAIASNIPFASSLSDNLWANSLIRTWLNDTFYNLSFDENEKNIIQKTTVKNNITGDFSSATSNDSGMPTQDFLYLLSYWDIRNTEGVFKGRSYYLSPTDFTIGNNVRITLLNGYHETTYRNITCDWWLRSAGSSGAVCFIDYGATIHSASSDKFSESLTYSTDNGLGICPAMRIEL